MKTMTIFLSTIFIGLALTHSIEAQDQKKKSNLTDADRLQISVQKICPVMGAKLGSMGEPIKIKMGEQTGYLCCKGCIGKQAKAEHWKKIQQNIAAAQQTCPIMGKPVDATMKSTVVKGQLVFVCCPPCIPKIQNAPEDALKKVNANYDSFIAREQQAKSDSLHILAQGICPVSGSKLGSMGPPIKVEVGEEHAFLCCKACVSKKIQADLWQTVQENLAKAQSVCLVKGEKIDASKSSTSLGGRKVFACCAACIKTIEADQKKYKAKLDSRISGKLKQDPKGHQHQNR